MANQNLKGTPTGCRATPSLLTARIHLPEEGAGNFSFPFARRKLKAFRNGKQREKEKGRSYERRKLKLRRPTHGDAYGVSRVGEEAEAPKTKAPRGKLSDGVAVRVVGLL